MDWLIVGQKGIATGQTFKLDQTPFGFGRNPDNRVVLAESQVSRHHAEIRLEQAGHTLYDLGSSNGTRVNGEVIREPRLLHDGDILTIAKNLFQIIASPAAQPPADEIYPRLLHLKPGEPALTVFLTNLPLTIGRDSKNAVVIQGRQASRFHAVIRQTPDGLAIVDLGSSNGTMVNKERVPQSRLLQHNDRVEIGGESFFFLAGPVSQLSQAAQQAAVYQIPAQAPQPQLAPLPPVPAGRLAGARPAEAVAHAPVEYGIKCPGRCGRTWPLYIEHCPIDGYLLANGQSVLLDVYNRPPAKAH